MATSAACAAKQPAHRSWNSHPPGGPASVAACSACCAASTARAMPCSWVICGVRVRGTTTLIAKHFHACSVAVPDAQRRCQNPRLIGTPPHIYP